MLIDNLDKLMQYRGGTLKYRYELDSQYCIESTIMDFEYKLWFIFNTYNVFEFKKCQTF